MKYFYIFAWILLLPSLSYAQLFDDTEFQLRGSRSIISGPSELHAIHTGNFTGPINPTLEEFYAVKLAKSLNEKIDRKFRAAFRDSLKQWEQDFDKWLQGYLAGLAATGRDTFEFGSKGYALICGKTAVHCYNRGAKTPNKIIRLGKREVRRLIEHVIATHIESGEWGSGYRGYKTIHVTEILQLTLYPKDENRNVVAPEPQSDGQKK